MSRIKFYALPILLLASTPGMAGELAASFKKKVAVGDSEVIVHMSSVSFSPESIGIDMSGFWEINGKQPLGGFPAKPSTRLGLFYVVWDGKRHNIPESDYHDVFAPNMQERRGWWENHGGVLVTVSEDAESVLIEMEASHISCCGYKVTWIVNRTGTVHRFVNSSVP